MSLDSVLEQVNRSFKKKVLFRGSDVKDYCIRKVSTGSAALDLDLLGGIALNRVSQIVGEESVGKSCFCAMIARSFIDNLIVPPVPVAEGGKRYVVYVDLEHSFDPQWVQFIGLDLDKFVLIQPSYGEEAFDILAKTMEIVQSSNDQVLFFFDSIAAAIPLKQSEAELAVDKKQPGQHAALVTQGLHKVLSKLACDLENDSPQTSLVFVNQYRMEIGKMFGDPRNPTGGKALRYSSHQIIKISRKENLNREEITGKPSIGHVIQYSVFKDKTGAKDRTVGQASFYRDPYPEKGIKGGCFDNAIDILPYAEQQGVIERRGHNYYFNNACFAKSKDEAAQYLRENISLYSEIYDILMERVRKSDRSKAYEAEQQRAGDQSGEQASGEVKKEIKKRGRPKKKKSTGSTS